jgi:molybdate transport system substrate-binding protein
MQEALLSGAPCDLMIVTAAMVDALVAGGTLRAEGRAALGRVRTGIAVRARAGAAALPDITSPDGLKAALLAAEAIYFPDPARATAGIHVAKVMRELGVHDVLAPRFRTFPNGATTMRALADDGGPTAIGCTQVTEILYTEGVTLVGALPARFELATVYTAAVGAQAADPVLAARCIALLTGPDSLALRLAGGFEV